ncbi:MAG: hypothetical protein HUJ31_07035, partial [Pseudomonadales bacterium]|nr:hypothetical protein [Pseudomonadales bacterium]
MISELRQMTLALTVGLLSVMAQAAEEPAIVEPAADIEEEATTEAIDALRYENWYQVEVIIFANRNFPASDEIWPLATMAYPDGMVSIGPVRDEDLTPHNL